MYRSFGLGLDKMILIEIYWIELMSMRVRLARRQLNERLVNLYTRKEWTCYKEPKIKNANGATVWVIVGK